MGAGVGAVLMQCAPPSFILKGFPMKRSMPILALLAALSLGACDRPTVVNVPATPAAVPGPAGPQGATGKSGGDTTVIVMPPASAPAN